MKGPYHRDLSITQYIRGLNLIVRHLGCCWDPSLGTVCEFVKSRDLGIFLQDSVAQKLRSWQALPGRQCHMLTPQEQLDLFNKNRIVFVN